MSSIFPSTGIAKKVKQAVSTADTALNSTIAVRATEYGVVYRMWVDLDVASETDLENLPASLTILISIGSTDFQIEVHPYIEHTDANTTPDIHRHVDLGPWFFDFGPDGFYSGVLGEDITFSVDAAGTGVVSSVTAFYSGD